MLSEVGLQGPEITDVILTHPHWDHMDAVGLVSKCTCVDIKEKIQLLCWSCMAKRWRR